MASATQTFLTHVLGVQMADSHRGEEYIRSHKQTTTHWGTSTTISQARRAILAPALGLTNHTVTNPAVQDFETTARL
jgi:hypothetical protein